MCSQVGADVTINYKTQNFSEEVLKATGGKGVDVILDFVGASYWTSHMQCVATDSRIVLLGLLGGGVIQEPVDLSVFLRKRVSLIPSTLRNRAIEYKHQLTQEIVDKVMPLLSNGQVKLIVDSVFPLAEAGKAHQHMKTNQNIGKIVLSVGQ